MRVYLTGFMGCGKSTVGELLAARRKVPFIDLDRRIEEAVAMSVRDIFQRHGEVGFRTFERRALESTGALDDVVVATGGGTLVVPDNAAWVRRAGVSVWINLPLDVIQRRIGPGGKEDRPLFRSDTEALALFRARLPAYRRADLRIDVTAEEDAGQVAARIDLELRATCGT